MTNPYPNLIKNFSGNALPSTTPEDGLHEKMIVSIETIPKLTRYGETTFLEATNVVKGAPERNPERAHSPFALQVQAQGWSWQYRAAMAFRENPNHECAWITLTYATEPDSWSEARADIARWTAGVQRYHKRVLYPAAELGNDYSKSHYIIVEEEGSLHGRKHFHCLWFSPRAYGMRVPNWKEPIVKWPHGFQCVKRVTSSSTTMHLAIYIAKYCAKSHGRVKCSSHFGLTTVTKLLSTSSWGALNLMAPHLCQKFVRRVSLTPNYPTSRQMKSCALLPTSSITSAQRRRPPKAHLRAIGLRKNGFRSVSSDASPTCHDLAGSYISASRFSLIKTAYREAVTLAEIHPEIASALSGLPLFGKWAVLSSKARLAKTNPTSVWFTKSAHPRGARNRAGRHNILVSQ